MKRSIICFGLVGMGLAMALGWPVMGASGWWKAGAPNDRFVTVDLTAYYHSRCIGGDMGDGYGIAPGELPEADSYASVGGVPFYVGKRDGGDNLDVGLAKWPEISRGPGDYGGEGWFYEQYKPKFDGDPECPVVHIPKQNYAAAYLLCIADSSEDKTPVVSFRLGLHDGNGILFDSSVTVPRWNEAGNKNVVASGEVALAKATGEKKKGRIFVVRAPLLSGDTQEVMPGAILSYDQPEQGDHLDLELTKELHVAVHQPDPNRFRIRPLGLPSAVHVLALTLERSPVQMKVTSGEAGNIFNEPQVPTFNINLKNITDQAQKIRIQATVTDYYGKGEKKEAKVTLATKEEKVERVALPQKERGWFQVRFQLFDSSGAQLLERNTSFALLPKDTRQATYHNSAFGIWCFGIGHRGTTIDKAGPLMQKAGVRRSFGYSYDELKKYGITSGQIPSIYGTYSLEKPSLEELKKTFAGWPDTKEALIFHESNIGPVATYPAFVVGEKPAPLDEATEAELQHRFELAVATSKAAREADPSMKLVFGNMTQPAIEQYLSRNYPKEYIDYLGDESPGFMRVPERQPEVAGFGSLWWMKEMAKYYGYGDVGLTVTFEWMYHCTNPGNNPERVASDYNVRDCLLAFAYGVPHVNPSLAYDVGNAYYFSNWGGSALCHKPPELNPKPGYVSYATMTQMLDLAKFSRKFQTGSTSVFALEFEKPDRSKVYTLWTIRGERDVKLRLGEDGTALVTDCMANERQIRSRNRELSVTVNSSPLYVTGVQVAVVGAGASRYTDKPGPNAVLLNGLDSLKDWRVVTRRDRDLEKHIWDFIQKVGKFAWEEAKDADRGNAIRVSLDGKQSGPDAAIYYNTLQAKRPIALPGIPKEIGLWVCGNSNWGRIIFELQDAKGETWTSIGAAASDGLADWNTNDCESKSFINFDGWRYLSVALPGQYPFDNYNWPRNCNWRHVGGDGLVDYPLRLTKLMVEMREKLVYVDEMVDATSKTVLLDQLMCSY